MIVTKKYFISIGIPESYFKITSKAHNKYYGITAYAYYNKRKKILIPILRKHFPTEVIKKEDCIGQIKYFVSDKMCNLLAKFSNDEFYKNDAN